MRCARRTSRSCPAVNGICQGGGLMIAMLSDVTVASDRATFRAQELFRGIADTHYAQILPRQIGPVKARDMLLTGRTVDARSGGKPAAPGVTIVTFPASNSGNVLVLSRRHPGLENMICRAMRSGRYYPPGR